MRTWDIFCDVIDNFGDIGVCWRLARQLAHECDVQVRLIVNDLASFQKICAAIDVNVSTQSILGVEICRWDAALDIKPADVVVEAFACSLPSNYINAMSVRDVPPIWINLEYLSAEAWVEDCHLLRSPQLTGPDKYFFFPGFTDKTGGLLREKDVFAQREEFISTGRLAFLNELGVYPQQDALLVALFTYGNDNITEWLETLQHAERPCHLIVPPGPVVNDIANWLGMYEIQTCSRFCCGQLTIHFIPYLDQQAFDRVLWSCDFNFVRGEDSLVRAIWAARPFLWHIYEQEDSVHLQKLQAFLAHYLVNTDDKYAHELTELWISWNKRQQISELWFNMLENLAQYRRCAENYTFSQLNRQSLAKSIANFAKN